MGWDVLESQSYLSTFVPKCKISWKSWELNHKLSVRSYSRVSWYVTLECLRINHFRKALFFFLFALLFIHRDVSNTIFDWLLNCNDVSVLEFGLNQFLSLIMYALNFAFFFLLVKVKQMPHYSLIRTFGITAPDIRVLALMHNVACLHALHVGQYGWSCTWQYLLFRIVARRNSLLMSIFKVMFVTLTCTFAPVVGCSLWHRITRWSRSIYTLYKTPLPYPTSVLFCNSIILSWCCLEKLDIFKLCEVFGVLVRVWSKRQSAPQSSVDDDKFRMVLAKSGIELLVFFFCCVWCQLTTNYTPSTRCTRFIFKLERSVRKLC